MNLFNLSFFGLGSIGITVQHPEFCCLSTTNNILVWPGIIILVLLVRFTFVAGSRADCLLSPFFYVCCWCTTLEHMPTTWQTCTSDSSWYTLSEMSFWCRQKLQPTLPCLIMVYKFWYCRQTSIPFILIWQPLYLLSALQQLYGFITLAIHDLE